MNCETGKCQRDNDKIRPLTSFTSIVLRAVIHVSGFFSKTFLHNLLFQVTDMMVANSHNLIVTVKPANQRNNVVHRGSKTTMGSVGSAGSTGSALSHDSPSPASQSNPITARYDIHTKNALVFVMEQKIMMLYFNKMCFDILLVLILFR